ncbi:MAG: transglycosylase family protein [Gaiellaceae bacterium]
MIRRGALRILVSALVIVALLGPALAGASSKRTLEFRQIQQLRHTTWHWQSVMGVSKTPARHRVFKVSNTKYRRWVLNLWQTRAVHVRLKARRVPHRAQWLCIHRGEGAWNARTGNGYYGGLQMDISFQRSYGGYLLRNKGTADNWSPNEQMWVAERAYRSGRGFYPWPNTARACGLI